MATRTINGKEYTKADFENKLRYLNDPQELANLLNELSEPYPYYVFRAKQLSFLADTNNINRRCKTFLLRKSMVAIVRLPHRKGHFMISCMR